MTKMLKFMKPQSKTVTPERLKKQIDLFSYNESCFHGFPAKPSALSWDSKLHLIAVGTRNGQIRIYGNEGVEFYGQEDGDTAVTSLCFLTGLGRIVSLCEDNSLHLWKIEHNREKDKCVLTKEKSTSLEGKFRRISIIAEDAECKSLLVGTEGGNIYVLDLTAFKVTDDIIYQDVVMQNVPDEYVLNPGSVEVLAPHPQDINKVLIGYQKGLIVLWDRKQLGAEQIFIASQQLRVEYLCWNGDASEFISSHNDGSYMIWSVDNPNGPKEGPTNVYGPFPCKPIGKILWKKYNSGYITVFGGGMPRASYGDRHTVTAMQEDNHVTFNLTSRVIDFIVTENEDGDASTLIILAEEEIVFIDLTSEGWPTFQNPYLTSLHSSAVTCSTFVSKVDSEVFEKLKSSGDEQRRNVSSKSWPISGGTSSDKACLQKDVLLTGHEDGTVMFWDSSGICLKFLYKLSTSHLFDFDDSGGDLGNAEDDDDWPPFRKVGIFDPYSDDPRLGLKKVEMCPHTGQLVVAGTAGQIIVFEIYGDEKSLKLQCVDVNLVAGNDNFVWKSHSKLDMKKEQIHFNAGMQPLVMIQFYPPASITSLNLHSEWGLVASGTAHGFALFDFIAKKNLLAKSTLSPLDLANAADEGPMSRRKSLKKSLRESFRRLRRGRSQKKGNVSKPKEENSVNVSSPHSKSAHSEEEAVKPVERAIEARTHAADYIGSMVRCLHLTKCYIASTQLMSATLWAGTNSGAIYIFTIAIPPSEKRLEVPLTVQLGKEIHLKHGAPVINILILDGANAPLPEPMAVKRGAAPSPDITSGPHRVLITSEEQFKVFTLPQLKPYCKYKLTAQEGSRVRKVGVSSFVSTTDKNYKESCLMVVTNQGDISVYSLPDARKQVMAQCIKREDISGINSVVFTGRGEALYLISAGELARISLSAENITSPCGKITLVKNNKSPACEVSVSPKKKEVPHMDNEVKEPVVEDSQTTSITKKVEELKENGDTSVLSGDITIDSIRDHMDEIKVSETSASSEADSSRGASAITTTSVSTVKEESSTKDESSITVVRTSNVTIVSSQETTSIQVVETNQTEENHTESGTEGSEELSNEAVQKKKSESTEGEGGEKKGSSG